MWIIQDWTGKHLFTDKTFGSFEEARSHISEHANATTTTEAEYNGVCEDLYAIEVLDPLDLLTIETAEQARDYAINWQNWWQSERNMFMTEVAEWTGAFEALAERFPELADEFRENAII